MKQKNNRKFIEDIALQRMYRLMDLALIEWEKHPERSLDYLKLMKKIGMRNKVKIPKELKKLYCKKCFSLLLESKDKEVRIKNKVLLVKCKNCGKIKKVFPEKKKECIVLGITGSIGTGKSTVLKEFESNGFKALNADTIAKKEMLKVKEELKEIIGIEAVSKHGIEFQKIAKIVFNNRKKLAELNELIHPLVRKKLEEEARGEKLVAIEIPLLFESGMQDLCDKILVIYSKKDKMIERKEKLGMQKEEVLKRLKNQLPAGRKKKKADFLVENNGTLKELQEKINDLSNKIKGEIK
ncbi:MAG: dephospho-CoA kinase [archaeon]